MGRGQGSMLLINYFFGTIVNGAFAVAKSVERNISPFASNFQKAAAPQIIQSYSSGDMERVFYLASRVGKYCLLMMMLAFFPLWAELDFILHMWLVKVPDGALVFCQIILMMVFVTMTDGGIGIVINASGKVSKFRIVFSIMTLSCVPVGYIILKSGCQVYMLLVVFLLADILWRLAQLYMMHVIQHFPVRKYCIRTYLPVAMASIPVVLCLIITSRIHIDSVLWHISNISLIFILTALSAYYLGLRKHEREIVFTQLFRRIRFM